MPNLMTRGRSFRDAKAPLAAGVTLSLSRETGDGEWLGTVTDAAIVGATNFRSESNGRVRVDFNQRDYLIPAASYAFEDLGVVEPRQGDRIIDTIDGTDYEYEVAAITGEPPVRGHGQSGRVWRVHVKRVTEDY